VCPDSVRVDTFAVPEVHGVSEPPRSCGGRLWPVFGRGPGCRGVAARSYRNNVRGATLVPYTDKLYAHSANLMTRKSRCFYGVLLGVAAAVANG